MRNVTASGATNLTECVQNTAAISQNTAAISQNTAAISQNTAAISQNTAAISQNTAAISQNIAAISQNIAAISNFLKAFSLKFRSLYVCARVYLRLCEHVCMFSMHMHKHACENVHTHSNTLDVTDYDGLFLPRRS
jgi:hypothetical protein